MKKFIMICQQLGYYNSHEIKKQSKNVKYLFLRKEVSFLKHI